MNEEENLHEQLRTELEKKDREILKLRNQLNRLLSELEKKNNESMEYLDEIANLEEEIMRYEEVVGENVSKKKSKKAVESKLQINLDAKDREIRDLKDRMGALRKVKSGIQRELEQLKSTIDSSVISVEELREKDKPPLNALLQDLQDNIKKKDSLIRKLKREKIGTEDIDNILAEKDNDISSLNEKIEELTEKLRIQENPPPPTAEAITQDKITKELIEDLQGNLKKKQRQLEGLKKKLEKYEKKKSGKQTPDVEDLQEELERKEKVIQELKSKTLSIEGLTGNETMEQVVEELKNQLSKYKSQTDVLQEQLKISQAQPITNGPVNPNFDEKLKIQREMASFLQKQLDEAKQALKTKEEEIATIKNEAIRIKRRYEDLDSQMKQRDVAINGLQTELDTHTQPIGTQTVNQDINLRIKELESLIDDLSKQNIQQRLEIRELRNLR